MMVSPVSFRATTAANFQEMLKRPQTYAEQPAAASTINAGEKKKGGVGKKILGLLVIAAAAAGGMVAVNKNMSKITPLIDKIKNEKIAGWLKTGAEKVSGWGEKIGTGLTTAISFVKTKGTELIGNLKNKAPQAPQG